MRSREGNGSDIENAGEALDRPRAANKALELCACTGKVNLAGDVGLDPLIAPFQDWFREVLASLVRVEAGEADKRPESV
jgi:hypothetical protein